MTQYTQHAFDADLNLIRTTAPEYMYGYADMTQKNHMLFSMMKKWGNIEYNASAAARFWQIRVREGAVHAFNNTVNKVFREYDPFEQMQCSVRGYESEDLLKEYDYKINRSQNTLINLYDFKSKDIAETLMKRVNEGLYRDGDSTEFSQGYQGFDSVLHCLNANNGGSAPTNADLFVLPNDTYAGHSTALATFGGAYSTGTAGAWNHFLTNDWPFGIGSPEYDATSPLLVNYEAEVLGTGSNAWADNVEDCIRHVVAVVNHRSGSGMMSEEIAVLLAADLYPAAENHYGDRYRIMTPFQGGDLGFPQRQMLQVDGVALKSDYAVPTSTGYIVCPRHLEMFNLQTMSMGGQGPEPMIDVFGPDWSPANGAFLYRVDTHGNLRIQPKYMGKIAKLSYWTGQAA